MAKVTSTAKFKILEFIDQFMDGTTANAMGRDIVDSAKQMIASGQSPVRGGGRFARYKNRKKYPGDKKEAAPVNLYLTGDMLAEYGFIAKNDSLFVGFNNGGKQAEIAGYHNSGTDNMAKRQIVPNEGDEWAVTIMRTIRDNYSKRLEFLIKQSNTKG